MAFIAAQCNQGLRFSLSLCFIILRLLAFTFIVNRSKKREGKNLISCFVSFKGKAILSPICLANFCLHLTG